MDVEIRNGADGEPQRAALVQLRAWLTRHDLAPDTRLPPERELCDLLGVSRGELRKALAALEAEGQLWRHVGKGTFVGARRIEAMSLADIDRETNPAEVMRTRLLVEPVIAREAALNATSRHVDGLRRCIERTRQAGADLEFLAAAGQVEAPDADFDSGKYWDFGPLEAVRN